MSYWVCGYYEPLARSSLITARKLFENFKFYIHLFLF